MSWFFRWFITALRIGIGAGLASVGYPKFAQPGHENTTHIFTELGVPEPSTFAYAAAVYEGIGGTALVVGRGWKLAAGVNTVGIGAALALIGLRGGRPDPLPGQPPLVDPPLGLGLMLGLIAVFKFGPGRLVWRGRS